MRNTTVAAAAKQRMPTKAIERQMYSRPGTLQNPVEKHAMLLT